MFFFLLWKEKNIRFHNSISLSPAQVFSHLDRIIRDTGFVYRNRKGCSRLLAQWRTQKRIYVGSKKLRKCHRGDLNPDLGVQVDSFQPNKLPSSTIQSLQNLNYSIFAVLSDPTSQQVGPSGLVYL